MSPVARLFDAEGDDREVKLCSIGRVIAAGSLTLARWRRWL